MTPSINVLIIEDESRAANRLERMLKTLNPNLVVCAKLPSIEKACHWLSNSPTVDLIFLDIQLEDGECFEIFNKITVTSPIIFCTAYNEYALQAFKVNSIDYLLKPINSNELAQALNKYQRLIGYRMPGDWQQLLPPSTVNSPAQPLYRKRFLVSCRQQLIPIPVSDITVISAFMKGIKLFSQQHEWLLDDSLADVATTLNPADFIRISRQSIVRIDAIQAFNTAKLEVSMIGREQLTLPVSRSRVAPLKVALSS